MSVIDVIAGRKDLDTVEQAAVAAADNWLDLYNQDDMTKFVQGSYQPHGDVYLFDGLRFQGRLPAITDMEKFAVHEANMLAARPGRRLRARHAIVSGNIVVLELDFWDVDDPTYVLPSCTILRTEGDKVLHDHTYIHRDDLAGAVDSLETLA